MALEIERKFLIKGDFRPFVFKSVRITQGYLSSRPERTVRIRIQDEKGIITIKGLHNKSGASRYEWEKEIPAEEAQELLKLCEPGVIEKVRHLVKTDPFIFEVDEFHAENEGLIIAEIELPNDKTSFIKPAWLGAEVTGDKRYYNSMLVKNPFTEWKMVNDESKYMIDN